MTAELNARYADTIIKNPADYDGIEIHGVRNLNAPDDPAGTMCEVDDETPEFFSVYVHCRQGGVECVGDFATGALAETYAHELLVKHGWPVANYVAGCRVIAQVPDRVLDHVKIALTALRDIGVEVKRAADMENKFGMAGRYQADVFTNRKQNIERGQKMLAEFRELATANGVDGEAVIAYLGGEPDLKPSAVAQAWLDDPRGPVVSKKASMAI